MRVAVMFGAGRRLLAATACLLLASAVGAAGHRPIEARLSQHLGDLLATRVAGPERPSSVRLDGIIVLGGSIDRVSAALDIAAAFPRVTLILSGPGEAEVAAARGRLEPARLIVDRRPRNTFENGLFSKDLISVHARDGRRCWAVVTSAVHMPRALGVFQALGIEVLPWPVGAPDRSRGARSAAVWHEVFGLMGYWALGRSRDLYPTCVDGLCRGARSARDCSA